MRRPRLGRADGELLELEPAKPRSAERAISVAVLPGPPSRPVRRAAGRLQRPPRRAAGARRVSARRRRRARRDRVVALGSRGGRPLRRGRRGRSSRSRGLSAPRGRSSRRGGPRLGGVHDLRRLGPGRDAGARSSRKRRAPVRLAPRDARAVPLPVLPQARPAHRAAEGARARHDGVARRHDGGLAPARGLSPLLRADHGGGREAGRRAPRRAARGDRRPPDGRLAREGPAALASSRSASGATTSSSPAARSSRSRRSTAAR